MYENRPRRNGPVDLDYLLDQFLFVVQHGDTKPTKELKALAADLRRQLADRRSRGQKRKGRPLSRADEAASDMFRVYSRVSGMIWQNVPVTKALERVSAELNISFGEARRKYYTARKAYLRSMDEE